MGPACPDGPEMIALATIPDRLDLAGGRGSDRYQGTGTGTRPRTPKRPRLLKPLLPPPKLLLLLLLLLPPALDCWMVCTVEAPSKVTPNSRSTGEIHLARMVSTVMIGSAF